MQSNDIYRALRIVAVTLLFGAGDLQAQPYIGGLPVCEASLKSCTANLGSCTTSLNQSQASLATCTSGLASCNAERAGLQSSLGSCTTSLSSCSADRQAAQSSLATCTEALQQATAAATYLFRHTGGEQTFTLPANVTSVRFELWGAGGGGGSSPGTLEIGDWAGAGGGGGASFIVFGESSLLARAAGGQGGGGGVSGYDRYTNDTSQWTIVRANGGGGGGAGAWVQTTVARSFFQNPTLRIFVGGGGAGGQPRLGGAGGFGGGGKGGDGGPRFGGIGGGGGGLTVFDNNNATLTSDDVHFTATGGASQNQFPGQGGDARFDRGRPGIADPRAAFSIGVGGFGGIALPNDRGAAGTNGLIIITLNPPN